jgi:hypothetical protein
LVDLELEQFMKSAEQGCHKYKRNNIEWSLYTGMWILRQWLLSRVLTFMSGKTRDPRNLFCDCQLKSMKDPCPIMVDELKTEFLVCKQNLELLKKHGPYFRLKFLKGLVSNARKKGNSIRATKITGIIQKEATRKWLQRINKTTGKAHGSLTLAVKVSIAEGGFSEFRTKESVFQAVSETLVERFQLALIAQCHQGTFFQDMGHLANGPVAQQILKGTYEYPQDLDPATRLLFEEAAATCAALSPTKIATYVTVEDFQNFWQTARECTRLYSGLHFGHYMAASFRPDLSLLHAAKLTICAKNGVSLA